MEVLVIMKTTVDIFSGFLGSGKTMLIRKLLSEKVYGKNTVIIENEFGEVGIDGEVLRESNIEIKEINAGCICCQVSGSFGDAVLEVINKYNPDNIIIEPSGVAKLSEILKILSSIKFEHKLTIRNIFTLIDIRNYNMYLRNFREFYLNQIKEANKIILSRTQFVSEENIKEVVNSLKKYNSKAEIIFKPWGEIKGSTFIKENESENAVETIRDIEEISIIKNKGIKMFKKEANHTAKEVFESYPIELIKGTSTDEMQKKFQFISNSSKFGKIVRAKGIIKGNDGLYYQFDYVPNEFKARKITWSNKNVVSIIGSELNKKELINLFS